jgi:lactoylglutathione lyase
MKSYTLMMIGLCLVVSFMSYGQKVTINHTAVFVVDCKVSAKFYHDIIGLDTIAEPFHDGKHVWMKTGPKSALHIIEGSTEKKEYYKNQHTCYSVPSVDKFVEVLKKNKIEFEDVQGNKNVYSMRPDKVKQLWLRDPDGYWLEINDAKE